MLGSCKKCPNCGGLEFKRILANRTIQCSSCMTIVEEYCNHDLAEYHVTTQSEELHCVVSPDFLRKHIVDDIPDDPYCTPGFITAFRMLSPQYEPVFGAPARTMSGALAEMERLIGDALYSGYVGYNGRAPGSSARGDNAESADRGKAGGDARHILVAYFEIKELASILGVDWETSSLAIRVFRYTASNTSLRNRSVELLAAASFIAAIIRRVREADEKRGTRASGSGAAAERGTEDPPWLAKLRPLTVRAIADAANINEHELQRNLKVVNMALRKQRPDSNESVVAQMPSFCDELQLPDVTRRLAIEIAETAMQRNICSRRAPLSVSAACIYMACHLDSVRKTQAEVCRATTVTEVTLRKVYKELDEQEKVLVPEWFITLKRTDTSGSQLAVGSRSASGHEPRGSKAASLASNGQQRILPQASRKHVDEMRSRSQPPLPPPLPPGYGQGQPHSKQPNSQGQVLSNGQATSGLPHQTRALAPAGQTSRPRAVPIAAASVPGPTNLNVSKAEAGAAGASAVPSHGAGAESTPIVAQKNGEKGTSGNEGGTQATPPVPGMAGMAAAMANMDPAQQASMMMAMMQNPAMMQVLANAISRMPHMMMPGMMSNMMMPPPPPPPPLPPKLPGQTSGEQPTSAAETAAGRSGGATDANKNDSGAPKRQGATAIIPDASGNDEG